jgi:protein-tyrosine phosphatase
MTPPLVDTHCHLFAGLDDGPRDDAEALEMCRLAHAEGTRFVAALAHQNERYKENTPDRLRLACRRLHAGLREAGLDLEVFPTAEVTLHPDMELSWRKGQLLSVGDHGRYLLVEMPHNLFVDLRRFARSFREQGVRLIIAHPERSEELLHDAGRIEELIEAGCLVQVSSGSVAEPRSGRDAKALKSWVRRGVVHLLGSDGHRPGRRPPVMAAAYRQVVRWAGSAAAERICSSQGRAVLQGQRLRVPRPQPQKTWRWLPTLW